LNGTVMPGSTGGMVYRGPVGGPMMPGSTGGMIVWGPPNDTRPLVGTIKNAGTEPSQ
jgi:hypothetical protein